MILSDDVSGDDSTDYGTEWDGDNVERREGDWESAGRDWESAEGDWESAEDATPDCRSDVDATDSCFHWTGQDAVGYGENFYTFDADDKIF
jgi:hypothetical protein